MKLSGLEKYFKTVNGEIVDFKQITKEETTPLMYALFYNKEKALNLNKEQFNYLIKNSDLNQKDCYGVSVLMFALNYNEKENINLNKEQWKYLIDNSDLSLIEDEPHLLIELKKIQSELLNEEILNKIDIKEEKNKKINKI